MTERSRGAPDPTEPSHQDDTPADSADLSALHRTDALIEALAGRAFIGSPLPLTSDAFRRPRGGVRSASGHDPVLVLLGALVSDVDEGLPDASGARSQLHRSVDGVTRHGGDPATADEASLDATGESPEGLPALSEDAGERGEVLPDVVAGRPPVDGQPQRDGGGDGDGEAPEPQGSGPSRRGPRTIVALGVAGAVLASTGVAAAGGGLGGTATSGSVTRAAGLAGPSRQVKAGGGGTSQTSPRPSAERPPVAPPTRGHEEKPRAGKSDTSPKGRTMRTLVPPNDERRSRNRPDETPNGRPPEWPNGRPPQQPDGQTPQPYGPQPQPDGAPPQEPNGQPPQQTLGPPEQEPSRRPPRRSDGRPPERLDGGARRPWVRPDPVGEARRRLDDARRRAEPRVGPGQDDADRGRPKGVGAAPEEPKRTDVTPGGSKKDAAPGGSRKDVGRDVRPEA